MEKQDLAKYIALGVVTLAAGAFALRNLTGDSGPQDWYYDLSEKRLYTAPLGSITPLPGIGGETGDGVEAKVVALEGDCGQASARRIAYLVTYTEEYRRLKEEVAKTGKSNQTSDRAFQAANTLVRRVDDADWSPAVSEEGMAIIDEFNDLMGQTVDGRRWRPCTPR